MELLKNFSSVMYELKAKASEARIQGGIFPKGRVLIGRTESCDLNINHEPISAVHAVIEILEDKAIIYDMNSTNGTYVNGEKVIKKEIHLGDVIQFADLEFDFIPHNLQEVAPPKALPQSAPKVSAVTPVIVYPLASETKAEASEYIFEDRDNLYPIFKYESVKQAVEVIILFKEQIFSVDFLPEGKSNYFISGVKQSSTDVEFPYLPKNERLKFVEMTGESVIVHTLPGFSIFHLSDKKEDTGHQSASIDLAGLDLVRLQKGDLQIYVRNVIAPPAVVSAPVIKADHEFLTYFSLFLGAVIALAVAVNLVKVPERIYYEDLLANRVTSLQPHVNPKGSEAAELAESKREILPMFKYETAIVSTVPVKFVFDSLRGHKEAFKNCNPRHLSGVLKLDFSIDASGKVSGAGVKASKDLPPDIQTCYIETIKAVTFNQPSHGEPIDVSQLFQLKPQI